MISTFGVVVVELIELVLILALSEINYRLGQDLSRKPNMRWKQYLEETEGGTFMHVLILVFCWPGLLYGDQFKVPKKN